MDSTHTVLYIWNYFQQIWIFQCMKINIGLNMSNFFKLIKTMSNNYTLTLFMEKNNENQLGIKIHNDEKIYKLHIN